MSKALARIAALPVDSQAALRALIVSVSAAALIAADSSATLLTLI